MNWFLSFQNKEDYSMILGEQVTLYKVKQNQREETEISNSYFPSLFSTKVNVLNIEYAIINMIGGNKGSKLR